MILVQIKIASINEKKDFLLDENRDIYTIKEEILSILKSRYFEEYNQDEVKDYNLYVIEHMLQLDDDDTLSKRGVKEGMELIFI